MVCKCLLDAFAAPDKHIKARTELHQVKQEWTVSHNFGPTASRCFPHEPSTIMPRSFGKNSQGKPYQSEKAAAKAKAVKKKKSGNKRKTGEQLVPMSQMQAMITASVQAAVAAEKEGKKAKEQRKGEWSPWRLDHVL
eukprot:584297-Pelagomonas_calceolata.AAC.1